MTKKECLEQIKLLINKAPRPDAIATIQAARAFKEVVSKANKCSTKNVSSVIQIYDQLKGYYQ